MKATNTLHLVAHPIAPVITRLPGESPYHFAKRCASIARLGRNWVRHPQYVFNPRHSCNLEVWASARVAFLACITKTAAADRERNKAFQSAERVRSALKECQ